MQFSVAQACIVFLDVPSHCIGSMHTHLVGSRSALVNMEARGELASMLNRKCVIVKWAQLSLESFIGLIERGAGSILVLLPPDISSVNKELIEVSSLLTFSSGVPRGCALGSLCA